MSIATWLMETRLALVTAVAVAAVVASAAALAGRQPVAQPAAQAPPQPAPASYYCLVHPEVVSNTPGICRKCGDPLVAGDPWVQREYVLDLHTTPAAPRAGDLVRFRMAVLDPETRTALVDFAVAQDKRFHMFIVGPDLGDAVHLVPQQQADGSWIVEHVLERPGYHRLFFEFTPIGGTQQVIARTLVTAGHTGDLESSIPRLTPDRSLVKTAGDTTVRLAIEPSPIVAGRTVQLRYTLTSGGVPVNDLEPYLSSWGYTVVLSEDALEYSRAHALEYVPIELTDPQGGPTLRFDATFPKPGRYRIWTEFKRHGAIWTAAYTVEAVAPSDNR